MGLTGKDAGFEIRKLDDLAKPDEKDTVEVSLLRGIVKGIAITVKLLVGIRGNQVTDLVKKYGRDVLRTPRDRDGKDKTDTNETTK